MNEPTPVTQLLSAWQAGDAEAEQQLAQTIYQTLRRLSARHMHGEQQLSLQATELVHEAYLKLVDVELEWQNRAHFYAVASRLMRRLLIDRARARLRQKRGGDAQFTHTDPDQLADNSPELHALQLDSALKQLHALDSRKSQIFELHFFAGLSYREIAEVVDVSEATVDRDLRFAKAWVSNEMRPA